MKKKLYIQPMTDLMHSAPQSIVCTSPGFGEKKEGSSTDPVFGEAPMRNLTIRYI